MLSPSIRVYDGTDKFIQYRKMASLRYYLLVDTEKQLIHFYERVSGDDWQSSYFTELFESIPFTQLGISISLADVYA